MPLKKMTLSELLKTPEIEALNDFLLINTGLTLADYINVLEEAVTNPEDFYYPVETYEFGNLTEN
jgi:hypothetical protein